MARSLGISPSYVNLLENNERSVSVSVLLRLFEVYGVDWRAIAEDDSSALLADLRAVMQDPLLAEGAPDLTQMRAALVHSPALVQAFLKLHRAWSAATDQLLALSEGDGAAVVATPEAAVHGAFRRNRNHFPALEEAAEAFWEGAAPERDEVYVALKRRLMERSGVRVRLVAVEELPGTLRRYDEGRGEILLSEALDHINRVFQLVHMAGLLECRDVIEGLVARSGIEEGRSAGRMRVELANYFAAAVLMPYGAFLAEARATKYDLDHIATRFGVSFEQACHRATTLQRDGAQGVPFFFLRIDKGGNVTKRFNATGFHLAEYGGLPAAGCAHVLPHAGADRAAVRGNARPVAVLCLLAHGGPADLGAVRAGQPAGRGDGLRGRTCGGDRVRRGVHGRGGADDADRDQLPHLSAGVMRPAGASRGDPDAAGG